MHRITTNSFNKKAELVHTA